MGLKHLINQQLDFIYRLYYIKSTTYSHKTTKEKAVTRLETAQEQELTRFTAGRRTYKLVPVLKDDEEAIDNEKMFARSRELKVSGSREEGSHLLAHGDGIPEEYQGNVFLIFPDWRKLPGGRGSIAYLYFDFDQDKWVQEWTTLKDNLWNDEDWFVRRVVKKRSAKKGAGKASAKAQAARSKARAAA